MTDATKEFLTDLREVLRKHEAYIEDLEEDELGESCISINSYSNHSLYHDLGSNRYLDAKYIDSVLNS